MARCALLVACAVLAGAPAGAEQAPVPQSGEELRAGDELFRAGRSEAAVDAWSQALSRARRAGAADTQLRLLARRAEGFQSLGLHRKAIADLKAAIAIARSRGDEATEARLRGSLGTVLHLANEPEPGLSAATELLHCLGHARRIGDHRLAAQTLNNLGMVHEVRDTAAARTSYEEAVRLAARAGDVEVEVTARLNATRLAVESLDLEPEGHERQAVSGLAIRLRETDRQIQAMPRSARKAAALVASARQWMSLPWRGDEAPVAPGQVAAQHLERAGDIAGGLGDLRNLSYAAGYTGELERRQGRLEDALASTRRALFHAREIDAPELEYRWHWQAARILRARGELDAAGRAYRSAVAGVRELRQALLRGGPRSYAAFRRDVAPLFFELVDLQLARADDPAARAAALREAVAAMEDLKAASIEHFYQDDCVARLESTARSVAGLSPEAVALYPIMLPDRLEIIVEHANGISHQTVAVGRAEVVAAIDAFLDSLGRPAFSRYRAAGARLYDWLVAPVEAEIESTGADTLVFILHDELATVPLAALYDCDATRLHNECEGHRAAGGRPGAHLVEKFAVSVAPGITLLDSRPAGRRARGAALLAGLTEGVQGFRPLGEVAREIREVEALFEGHVLLDADFTRARVESELGAREFSIVHIASHAKFLDDGRSSFVVSHDGKLTMDDLEGLMGLARFRDRPVELLTLSACETAVGDPLAALGLAGIAIKSGARSALASLWSVDDSATAVLIPEFYRQLAAAGTTKAQALRRAQLRLIREEEAFTHPRFWSPFLVIGNWL